MNALYIMTGKCILVYKGIHFGEYLVKFICEAAMLEVILCTCILFMK